MEIKENLLQLKYKTIEEVKHQLALFYLRKLRQWANGEMPEVYKEGIKPIDQLAADEVDALRSLWGQIGLTINKKQYGMIKNAFGGKLDPRYVSDDIFFPYILRSLNPYKYAKAYEFKGMYRQMLPNVRMPKTYINCINDVFYDGNNNVVSRDRAKELLKEKTFIVKPSCDSCQGKDVRIYHNATEHDINEVFEKFDKNFIVQEVCTQSEKTKKFSRKSLNTFRVTTLYINGRFSVLSIVFRCGRGDSVVDNCGAGGLMCGVSNEGCFKDFACDKMLTKYYETEDGVRFKGTIIPEVKQIVSTIEETTRHYIPHCGVAGWDFALDSDNNPVMIEVNLGGSLGVWPSILWEQICYEQPLFGERTAEVIEYVKNYPPPIGKYSDAERVRAA